MLADTVPLYELYALLFADRGLSGSQISALFVVGSAVGIVAEVPFGALADRFSRRGALAVAGVFQAGGYALWTAFPDFGMFAAGMALWGLGGALVSGSLEALLYDGLAALGAEAHYPRVRGRIAAATLLAQLPAAAAATVLFSVGGYPLVGWVSVGVCLVAGALALRLPEAPRQPDQDEPDASYLATLRAGVVEVAGQPAVRIAVLAVAAITGLDALDEYFPLLAHSWGVPTVAVPLALLGIPLAGAAGAALGGRASRLRPAGLAVLLGVSFALLGVTGLVRLPVGLVGVAVSYCLYRVVLVVVDVRLQQRIEGPGRATVTSVAALGTELGVLVFYAAWAIGQVLLVAALGMLIALVLPRWSRER